MSVTGPSEPTAVPAAWLDDLTRSALQLIAEALVELAGFGVAAISVARDDGLLHMAVVAGSDEARAELARHTTPIDALQAELGQGDRWGHFTFVAHERLQGTGLPGWVPDLVPIAGPDAWHPEDLLVALLYDADGVLRGSLAIDVPDDGRRPGPERREMLERFAGQAERAVVTALERARLADQVRLADSAREVVRRASSTLDMSRLLDRTGDALLTATGAVGLWLRIFREDGDTVVTTSFRDHPLPREPRTGEIAERGARRLWVRQRVGALYADTLVDLEADDETRALQRYVAKAGLSSLLLVPLGVGAECLGSLTFARPADAPPWSEAEMSSTFALGCELGQLLFHAEAYRRAQQLTHQLRALDEYKNRLVTAVAEELRRPLTAIADDLARLGDADDAGRVGRQLAAMDRGMQRMVGLVEDLVLLSRASDPANALPPQPVDLVPIVREAAELSAAAAGDRGLTVRVLLPDDGPVVTVGDAVELDRVVVNLLSNAVKYSLPGGAITVSLRTLDRDDTGRSQVELVVADEGIGISPEDRPRLFTEFFRTTNALALDLPGTGLGLAIVDRVVGRHGGSIEVESEVGTGSTFRVLLPAGGGP